MATDLKISAAAGATGGAAETLDLATQFQRKDGVYVSPFIAGDSGYLGMSVPLESLSPTAVTVTSTYGYLTRVKVPAGGVTSFLDVMFTAYGSPSNAIFGLFSGTGLAPVAYTAESHGSITANGLTSIAWSTPATLLPGYYYVYMEYTATSPTMPGVTMTSTGSVGAAILNANTALANGTLNSASLSSSAPSTISSSTTLTFGTGWAQFASKLWFGLR